jgi:hypothetical protein
LPQSYCRLIRLKSTIHAFLLYTSRQERRERELSAQSMDSGPKIANLPGLERMWSGKARCSSGPLQIRLQGHPYHFIIGLFPSFSRQHPDPCELSAQSMDSGPKIANLPGLERMWSGKARWMRKHRYPGISPGQAQIEIRLVHYKSDFKVTLTISSSVYSLLVQR